jgi:hypothetical protein
MLAFATVVGIAYDDSSLLDRQIKHLFIKLQQIETTVRNAVKVCIAFRIH